MDTLKLTWRDPDDSKTFGLWFDGSQLWWWSQEDATQLDPPGAKECQGVQTRADFLERRPARDIPVDLQDRVREAVEQASEDPSRAPLCWHDEATIRAAIAGGVDPRDADARGFGALHRVALSAPDLDLARQLIAAGASGLDATRSGSTPLSIAARRGRVELVRMFAAEADVPGEQLDRALYDAIEYGIDLRAQEDTALALLELGADPSLPRQARDTAFTRAAHRGMPRLLEVLLQSGHGDLAATSRYGQGVVLLAVPTFGRPERERALKLLIEAGADVNALTEDGYAPLDEAARFGCVVSARLLIEAGAERRERTFRSGQRHDNPELDALLRPEAAG